MRFTNAQIMNELEGVLNTIELALLDRPTPNPTRKREGRMSEVSSGDGVGS